MDLTGFMTHRVEVDESCIEDFEFNWNWTKMEKNLM